MCSVWTNAAVNVCHEAVRADVINHRLHCHTPAQVPNELWQAVVAMPNLQQLEIGAHASPDDPLRIDDSVWAALAACSQLTELEFRWDPQPDFEHDDEDDFECE